MALEIDFYFENQEKKSDLMRVSFFLSQNTVKLQSKKPVLPDSMTDGTMSGFSLTVWMTGYQLF